MLTKLKLFSLQNRFQFHEERLFDFPLFDSESFNLLPWRYLSFWDSVHLDEIKREISTDRYQWCRMAANTMYHVFIIFVFKNSIVF